jgi:hypothetical protein
MNKLVENAIDTNRMDIAAPSYDWSRISESYGPPIVNKKEKITAALNILEDIAKKGYASSDSPLMQAINLLKETL